MRRINIRKPEVKESNEKVDAFMDELKEKLDDINEVTDKVIDNVVTPVTKFVINDVVPVVVPVVEEVIHLLNTEAPENIVTKQTIKINEPIIEQEPEEVNDYEELKDENQQEVNTIILHDKILPYEECLLKISPVAKLPISHILSANLIFENPCDSIQHEIIENDDPCSFSIYVKNNGNEELSAKVTYNVLFDK